MGQAYLGADPLEVFLHAIRAEAQVVSKCRAAVMCRQYPVKRLMMPGHGSWIDGHRADEGKMLEAALDKIVRRTRHHREKV